jgi:hypothetical protein
MFIARIVPAGRCDRNVSRAWLRVGAVRRTAHLALRWRVVVVYLIHDAAIGIVRIFYGGRNIEALLAERR